MPQTSPHPSSPVDLHPDRDVRGRAMIPVEIETLIAEARALYEAAGLADLRCAFCQQWIPSDHERLCRNHYGAVFCSYACRRFWAKEI